MSRSINSINSDTIYGLIRQFIGGYLYLSIEILNTWIWGKTAKRYSLLYSRIEFMRSQTIGFGLRNISHFAKESLRINTTARCTKISLSNQKNIGIQNSVCCPPLIRTLLHGKQRQSEEETNFSFMIDWWRLDCLLGSIAMSSKHTHRWGHHGYLFSLHKLSRSPSLHHSHILWSSSKLQFALN